MRINCVLCCSCHYWSCGMKYILIGARLCGAIKLWVNIVPDLHNIVLQYMT